jgi:arylsulfate sulfotransferase
MAAGRVEETDNPQVAQYTIAPPTPADVTIHYGPDERYGLSTWTRHAAGSGAPVPILIAGMRPKTRYYIRATIRFSDGTLVTDPGHVFDAGALPPRMRDWQIRSERFQKASVQSGIELLNSSTGVKSQIALADLDGRILWTFEMPERETSEHILALRLRERMFSRMAAWFGRKRHSGPLHDELAKLAQRQAKTPEMLQIAKTAEMEFLNPVKVLPNGDFLLLFSLSSQSLLSGPSPPGVLSALREIDLAGRTVRQITLDELNERLHDCGHPELKLQTFHHDVEVLPNGHWIVIANQFRPGSDPGQGETDIFGDVLVELDNNLNPVWTWNTFDHLDIHRRPMWSPDWTHSNALIYTPDDGNLLLSMRHQSWVIKIDYRNGAGSGKILWRLGQGGDFKLVNGRDPEDWQYGQHLPAILGARSAGVFRLALMDNGDGRLTDAGGRCVEPGSAKSGERCYSTVPVFEIDEKARTAKIIARKVFPVGQYSAWGGGTVALPDGAIEATLSSQGKAGLNSVVMELTNETQPQEIWQMEIKGNPIYRAERIPSPYRGVQW